ncbi:MAG: YeeE/YedE family protein [Rhodospirillales bacterium]|jgi:uncharacterized protein|nr:YeeE/YedE family protein [Rhodospirillales bacterium]MBT4039101.1 YeeE/YedE family protein [Rhodospirillales bacterium]MBT4625502.1 YeeE/YedE family protein [Rhodospirillales bacterium]MBT5352140.1 YeeE/YedE family protein [Rhodospirillales bacterium]MBT5521909.1 YeeE/YedE family protein [Rhodospirillales bacterium]
MSGAMLQRKLSLFIAAGLLVCITLLFQANARSAQLLILGLALGITLYHASFGFSGAYRRFIVDRDMSGITAQLIMLAVAIIGFALLLSEGDLRGAVAPVGMGMITGAFLFGIGMQVAGGCASGTLFAAGGGSLRMMVVLVFFCVGAFVGSLHLSWWKALPGIGSVSFGHLWGWPIAVAVQLGALGMIYMVLRRMGGWHAPDFRNSDASFSWKTLCHGPWSLVSAGIALALLNVATLVTAGHPWSVTWGYTLWGAKAAVIMGWESSGSDFWQGRFGQAALARSIFHDSVSIMNLGILAGAALAASMAGRLQFKLILSFPQFLSAMAGGLILGYGARLAYGCNIGAFFSGVASGSLHGWVWIMAAALGNIATIRAMRHFTTK